MDYPGRLIAGFIVIILLFVFPLQYIAQSYSEDIDVLVSSETKALTDTIRKKGYLDLTMYEEYINFLNQTRELYEFEIEDIHPVIGEELAENMSQEQPINSKANKKESGNTTVHALYLHENEHLDHIKASSFGHVHTSDCYVGHRHDQNCGTRYYYTGAAANYRYVDGYSETSYSRYTSQGLSCSRCGGVIATAVYDQSKRDLSINNPVVESLTFTANYLNENNYTITKRISVSKHLISYVDDGTGWQQGYGFYYKINAEWDRYYTIFASLYLWGTINLSAWREAGYKTEYGCAWCLSTAYNKSLRSEPACDLEEDTAPICDRVLISIVAVNPVQTVIIGSNIDTTARATYLDGHNGIVNCTASGYNPNTLGNQSVTLTYRGLIHNANTTGELTCTVNVNVIPKRSLSSITVSPSSQIVERLSNPGFTVTAYYSDGSSAVINSGQYILTGYDSSKTGAQTVTISYTEAGITKTASATVLVNGLTGISVTPAELTVERYTAASSLNLLITASYLYGSNKSFSSGYLINGYNPSLLGKQNVTVSFTDKGITKTATMAINVTVLKKQCFRCHNIYDLNTDDSDPGCPFCKGQVTGIEVFPGYVEVSQGEELPVTVEAIYRDGSRAVVYGWSSNYSPDNIGIQSAIIEYGGYAKLITVNVREREIACPECGTLYPVSAGKCPACSERVIAISVEPERLTVYQFEKIDIAVTACFADGSSRLVNDWSIDCSTSRPGNYKATVKYKEAYSVIDLFVLSVTSEQCPICGYIYDKLENPDGCPVCFTTLTGIEAYLLDGGNKVQYGTMPDIALVLIFRDGHRELKTEGYILENYNPYRLGIQTLTVMYDGFETTLTLELVNTLSAVTCPNGHVYYLNEDGTDPACPYCRLDSSKSSIRYYDIKYTTEILDELYEKGCYQFKKGNYITIRLIKRDKSILYRLQKMFFKTSILGRVKRFVFGGEVF